MAEQFEINIVSNTGEVVKSDEAIQREEQKRDEARERASRRRRAEERAEAASDRADRAADRAEKREQDRIEDRTERKKRQALTDQEKQERKVEKTRKEAAASRLKQEKQSLKEEANEKKAAEKERKKRLSDRDRAERQAGIEERKQHTLRRRFINDMLGSVNQAHLGRRVNHAIDFFQAMAGDNKLPELATPTGPVTNNTTTTTSNTTTQVPPRTPQEKVDADIRRRNEIVDATYVGKTIAGHLKSFFGSKSDAGSGDASGRSNVIDQSQSEPPTIGSERVINSASSTLVNSAKNFIMNKVFSPIGTGIQNIFSENSEEVIAELVTPTASGSQPQNPSIGGIKFPQVLQNPPEQVNPHIGGLRFPKTAPDTSFAGRGEKPPIIPPEAPTAAGQAGGSGASGSGSAYGYRWRGHPSHAPTGGSAAGGGSGAGGGAGGGSGGAAGSGAAGAGGAGGGSGSGAAGAAGAGAAGAAGGGGGGWGATAAGWWSSASAFLGPFGLAIVGATAAVVAAIVGFRILDRAAQAFADTLDDVPSEIIFAKLQNNLDMLNRKLQRADEFGEVLADIERTRGERDIHFMDIVDNIMGPLLPVIREGSDLLNNILQVIKPMVAFVVDMQFGALLLAVEKILWVINKILGGQQMLKEWLVEAIEDIFPPLGKALRKYLVGGPEKADVDILKGLFNFMNNNPVTNSGQRNQNVPFEFNIDI